MSENTTIEWADHTFNPWEGCKKIGPSCDIATLSVLEYCGRQGTLRPHLQRFSRGHVKEHAILFSVPMIRALIDGTKSRTRRVVKLRQLSGDYIEGGSAGVDGFCIPRDSGPALARFSA
jgi:hypothetical protein